MKTTLLLAGALTFISLGAQAQIDDVVNKPKEKKAKVHKDPTFAGDVFKTLFNRIQAIEFDSLVDQMKHDGVTERKFGATVNLEGRIVDANVWQDDVTNSKILPFVVKLTSDKKVYVSVSGVDFGNVFEGTIDNGGFDNEGFNPISKLQFAVFRYDEGVSFRDIKSVSISAFDAEIKLPAMARGPHQYLAFVLGADLGWKSEDITLDNGQTLQLRGRANTNNSSSDKGGKGLGFNFNAKGGLELQDEYGIGVVTLKGIFDINSLSGDNKVPKSLGGALGEEIDHKTHTQMYVSPSLSLSRSLGKKTSLTLGVSMNINLMDRINTRRDLSGDSVHSYKTTESLDIGSRTRQPFNASLKLNF